MSEISVTVNGSTTINPTVGNGDTVSVTIASTGERGPTGNTGSAGPANTLAIGTVSQGTAAATITGTAPNQVLNLVLQKGDAGTNIELQATGTHIQWRLVGASTWTNLVALSAITGPTGSTGAAGAAVELQASGTHIQWRYVGGSTWTNVVALSSLVGATGATGATGPQGPSGIVNLADETPQPLGTASAGTALTAARADHVHAQGSIAYSGLTGIPSTFAPSAHTHAVSDITGLQTQLDGKQAAGTYATLVNNQVPSANLPSFVDDVVDVGGTLPASGDVGKIYVVSSGANTNKIYRWSGSTFVEISPSPGSTDSVTEGATNLYFTNARAAAAAPVQSVAGRSGTVTLTKSDVGLGSVDNTADASKPVSTAQAAADAAVQAYAIQRANHTGAQAISTVTGLQTSLDGKAATSHTHSLANLTQSSATTGQVPVWNGSAWAAATPTGGGSGNIVEAETAAGFPATGASGTVYIATDASRAYRWSGSVYVEIGTSGGGGSGGDGADSTLRSLFVPSAPTSVTASAGNAQATVSWTAPTGTISQAPVTDYVVQYSSNSGSTWATFSDGTSTSTSAAVTGLTNGTAYTFRVAAVNGVGQGAWSTASSAATPSAFSASAVILTSGTSYTVPSGASTMKVWAVGPGGQDGGARGHAGAVAYKTWSVSGGQSVSYAIGARSVYSGSYSRSGSTTVTFGGTTITAEGGGGPNGPDAAATYSGGDGGANGGQGGYVNGNNAGGAVGGNGTLTECGRYPAIDVSGLFAAVTMAGGNVTESCGTTAAFGSGASAAASSLAGIGGGGAWYGVAASDDGGVGAVVIQFS